MSYTTETVLLEAATRALTNAPKTTCVPTADWFCLTSSEWASWVQAIGSVAAIVASVLLVRHQQRLATDAARSAAKAEERREHIAVVHLLSRFNELLDGYFKSAGTRDELIAYLISHGISPLRDTFATLQDASAADLATPESRVLFRTARRVAGSMMEYAESLHREATNDGTLIENRDTMVTWIAGGVGRLHAMAADIEAELQLLD